MVDAIVLNTQGGIFVHKDYVHGYHSTENQRLHDQAGTLADLLHGDTAYPPGHTVLEVGCGVGAQTALLARHSSEAFIVSVEVSHASAAQAAQAARAGELGNVKVLQADLFALPFATASFEHVFVCFVLEHLPDPLGALHALRRVLKPGGSITVIEGDHGSTFFHPDSALAHRAIQCLVELQARAGGNALLGRSLYPLLRQAGFEDVAVSPRMVYADESRPDLVEGFTRRTFTAMIEGVREPVIKAGLMDEEAFEEGIAALYRTAEADGVFCYTFFKAVAVKPAISSQNGV